MKKHLNDYNEEHYDQSKRAMWTRYGEHVAHKKDDRMDNSNMANFFMNSVHFVDESSWKFLYVRRSAIIGSSWKLTGI